MPSPCGRSPPAGARPTARGVPLRARERTDTDVDQRAILTRAAALRQTREPALAVGAARASRVRAAGLAPERDAGALGCRAAPASRGRLVGRRLVVSSVSAVGRAEDARAGGRAAGLRVGVEVGLLKGEELAAAAAAALGAEVGDSIVPDGAPIR